jgi:hypothetical protein
MALQPPLWAHSSTSFEASPYIRQPPPFSQLSSTAGVQSSVVPIKRSKLPALTILGDIPPEPQFKPKPSQLSSTALPDVQPVNAVPKRRSRVSEETSTSKLAHKTTGSDASSASTMNRKTTRRSAAETPSWAVPGSADWDGVRVLYSDQFLAPDHLLEVSSSDNEIQSLE